MSMPQGPTPKVRGPEYYGNGDGAATGEADTGETLRCAGGLRATLGRSATMSSALASSWVSLRHGCGARGVRRPARGKPAMGAAAAAGSRHASGPSQAPLERALARVHLVSVTVI